MQSKAKKGKKGGKKGASNPPRPRDLVTLADKLERSHDRLTPLVVSRPAWLVGEAAPPYAPVAWEARKLLFMSGHAPKLFNKPPSPHSSVPPPLTVV